MKRGEIVTLSLPGRYGKPRPAVIVQAGFFEAHPSLTALPITSELREAPLFRVRIAPGASNGLRKVSEVMIDTAHTIAREKIGRSVGRLDEDAKLAVDRALTVFLGFG